MTGESQSSSADGSENLSFEEAARVAGWNRKIRPSESVQDSEIDSDHLAIAVKQWASRTAGRCRRIVDNLVFQDIANVPLRRRRTYQFLLSQPRHDLIYILAASGDSLRNI
jgi:hypothetical protein